MAIRKALLISSIFGLGVALGLILPQPSKSSLPVWQEALVPQYSVQLTQSIEYGLLYTKTNNLSGESQIYRLKDGKLEAFLPETKTN